MDKLLLSFFWIIPITRGDLRPGKTELTGVFKGEAFSFSVRDAKLLAFEHLAYGNDAVQALLRRHLRIPAIVSYGDGSFRGTVEILDDGVWGGCLPGLRVRCGEGLTTEQAAAQGGEAARRE